MPPKRPGSRSASSSASTSTSSGSSSSSSSDSSSSGSDSSSDSDSSQGSQRSRRSKRNHSSASSTATSANDNESPQKSSKKSSSKRSSTKKSGGAGGAAAKSRSASSASSSGSESSPKKSADKKSKKSLKESKKDPAPRAVPKKSATAKPITKAVTTTKKQLSDNDSDSDFGDFSLPKLAAKAKQAKRAATEAAAAASLSPASQPSPSTKSIVQPSKLAAAVSSLASASHPKTESSLTTTSSSKATSKSLTTSTPTASSTAVDKSKMKSIFSESSGTSSGDSSDSDAPPPTTTAVAKPTKDTATKETTVTTPAANNNKSKKKAAAAAAATSTPATTKKSRSPSPPKLTPQKKTPSPAKTPGKRGRPVGSGSKKSTSLGAAAVASLAARATASAAKMRSKKKTAGKKNSSTASSAASASNSAASSASSSSSSDSSSDEKEEEEKTTKKKGGTTSKPAAKTKPVTAPTTKIKDKVKEEKVASKKTPATNVTSSSAVAKTPMLLSTDSEGGKPVAVARPTTRKTRGANVRKSRHVTGKNVSDSDSDMEVTLSKAKSTPLLGNSSTPVSGSVAKKKFTAVLFPPVRKEIAGLQPIEKRLCPMQGCDSSGHMGGKLDRHFLLDSCPVFHNMTRKSCRDFRAEVARRAAARKKALSALATRSPLGSPTSDQKKNAQTIHEVRSKFREEDIPVTDDMPEDCEPDLNGFTSEWDLQMFREAQAETSEILEDAMRGLPDTKQTRYLEMGSFEMEVWYQSPYPDDFSLLPKMYICEFCLKYHRSATQLKRHAAKCVWNHPPGDEIYRKEPISVFEICGKRYKQYCQSLCLLAKFFLDHKTLYFDVEPFLFYVMTTADSAGCHIVGYFSKEKNSVLNYNVSCILTLPPYQRQGYGRLLIDFSYLLSRAENKIGSPEKPLSDLGLITYRAYWKDVLLEYICNYPEKEISIKSFSEEMGINPNDIISTLQFMGMIKYWKGQHLILKREDLINDYLEKSRNRPKGREIYPSALKWKPYQPSAKERKQAEQIKKNQEKQKKR